MTGPLRYIFYKHTQFKTASCLHDMDLEKKNDDEVINFRQRY